MTDQLDVRPQETLRPAPTRHRRGVAVALLLLALLGAGLWFLTPTHLGGSTTYLVTRGTSMLPTHEPGALVVVRTQEAYIVGDVIAFRTPEPERIVLHRIVRTEGDRFVTRGDNNSLDDSFRPGPSDVVGTPWLHVPRGAEAVARLSTPAAQGIAFGVLSGFAFGAVVQRRRAALDRRLATGSAGRPPAT